jgi:phage gp36-like protein
MYASHEELFHQFGEQLIDLAPASDPQPGDPLYAVPLVNEQLQNAAAEANSYIGVTYQLPLPPVILPALRDKVIDIAVHLLFRSRVVGETEDVNNRYKQAIAWLKDIRDGKAMLPGITPKATAAVALKVPGTRITHTKTADAPELTGF